MNLLGKDIMCQVGLLIHDAYKVRNLNWNTCSEILVIMERW